MNITTMSDDKEDRQTLLKTELERRFLQLKDFQSCNGRYLELLSEYCELMAEEQNKMSNETIVKWTCDNCNRQENEPADVEKTPPRNWVHLELVDDEDVAFCPRCVRCLHVIFHTAVRKLDGAEEEPDQPQDWEGPTAPPENIARRVREAEANAWTELVWFRSGRVEGRPPASHGGPRYKGYIECYAGAFQEDDEGDTE